MKFNFIVFGYMPAYGKKVNDFMAKLDLGVEGAYVAFCDEVSFSSDKTHETQVYIDAIIDAYEKCGCIDVNVVEVTNDNFETLNEASEMLNEL